jgi:malonyl-CoA O-methyltransferase
LSLSHFSGMPLSSVPVLFLPGWGFSGQVMDLAEKQYGWARLVAPLDPVTALPEIMAFLSAHHLGSIHLVGWSMGASLALDFAAAFPDQVATLTLLGLRSCWPPSEINAIRQALTADPPVFLRDFYRKSLLGYKKEARQFVVEQQETLMQSLNMEVLIRGLDYLGQWRLPEQMTQCPVFCWHGRRDIVAPVTERAIIPGACTTIIEHGGHALFLDREFVLGA